MIARITQIVLERENFYVKHAIHGQEAFTVLVNNYDKYNIVLMDILMPVMDGITCTKKMRQFEKDNGHDRHPIPIIALTANTVPGHRNECKDAGCTDYVKKPINYPSLALLVRKHIAHKKPPSS